ncbi:DHC1 [Scenedesmus sp. PABB004]|nr:DHC1 [Scenedesmus sp. PABB004]
MAFWKVAGFSQPSPIESILDKEEYTLEELLDEDDIIQECKSLNGRLITFLREKKTVEQLLRYLIEPQNDADDPKKQYRYPFTACEVFCCEVEAVFNTLLEDEALLALLFSLLDASPPLPCKAAGYFGRVVGQLLLRKTNEMMQHLSNNDEILARLIRHVDTTSIADIIKRLVGADDHSSMIFLPMHTQWLAETPLVSMLLDRLAPEHSAHVQANAADILTAIAHTQPSALASQLMQQPCIAALFSRALEPGSQVLVTALDVCAALLEPRRAQQESLAEGGSPRSGGAGPHPEAVASMLAYLPALLDALRSPGDPGALQETPYGVLAPPLGRARLRIVELLAALLRVGDDGVDGALIGARALPLVQELFAAYPFNNLLHHQMYALLAAALRRGSAPMVAHIFGECGLVGWLAGLPAEVSPRPRPGFEAKGPLRAGYLGHVTRIGQALQEAAGSQQEVADALRDCADWAGFVEQQLAPRLEVEDVTHWQCGRPVNTEGGELDSDGDFQNDMDALEQIQGMPPGMYHRYGVLDDIDDDDDEPGEPGPDAFGSAPPGAATGAGGAGDYNADMLVAGMAGLGVSDGPDGDGAAGAGAEPGAEAGAEGGAGGAGIGNWSLLAHPGASSSAVDIPGERSMEDDAVLLADDEEMGALSAATMQGGSPPPGRAAGGEAGGQAASPIDDMVMVEEPGDVLSSSPAEEASPAAPQPGAAREAPAGGAADAAPHGGAEPAAPPPAGGGAGPSANPFSPGGGSEPCAPAAAGADGGAPPPAAPAPAAAAAAAAAAAVEAPAAAGAGDGCGSSDGKQQWQVAASHPVEVSDETAAQGEAATGRAAADGGAPRAVPGAEAPPQPAPGCVMALETDPMDAGAQLAADGRVQHLAGLASTFLAVGPSALAALLRQQAAQQRLQAFLDGKGAPGRERGAPPLCAARAAHAPCGAAAASALLICLEARGEEAEEAGQPPASPGSEQQAEAAPVDAAGAPSRPSTSAADGAVEQEAAAQELGEQQALPQQEEGASRPATAGQPQQAAAAGGASSAEQQLPGPGQPLDGPAAGGQQPPLPEQQQQEQQGLEQQLGPGPQQSEGAQQPEQQQEQQPEQPCGLQLFLGHVPAQTFYCINSREGPLPHEGLSEVLDCGLLTLAPSLSSLEQVLSEVFLPLLVQQVGTADPAAVGAGGAGAAGGGRARELLGGMQKYLATIQQAAQQLTGDVALPMPAVPPGAAARDPDALHALEEAVAGWSATLSDVLQRESEKRPGGKGPLAEVDFWRARSAALSGLAEQLSGRAASDVLAALEAGSDDRALIAAIRAQAAELGKLAHEARDNVKFLTTLERHFRSIATGPLPGILDTLPPLMNALRMVWIISRHYSDDARMGALFARVACELCDRVEGAVLPHALFRVPAAEAAKLLRVSKAVLESWQSTYMQARGVREKIEANGRDARWEFSKASLFARSSYMADVCGQLAEMVEVVDDFFKFLGPELKAVTGDAKGIDDVIEAVELMVEPVETAPFCVFDAAAAPQWRELRRAFAADNDKVKASTRELIDTSFRKLRSAEGAFELLQNFKSIKSRGAIQAQMMNKLQDILEQFVREIAGAQEMFDRCRAAPPLTRNQPPVAGAIHWSHQLFSRVKLTMSKLDAVEPDGAWRALPVGQQVHERYMGLARAVLEFEKAWFAGWRDSADGEAMRHLKAPIFARHPDTGVVAVNFHPALRELMAEAHYLDRKGFAIPPLALQVALQEGEYRGWTESLERLLDLFYQARRRTAARGGARGACRLARRRAGRPPRTLPSPGGAHTPRRAAPPSAWRRQVTGALSPVEVSLLGAKLAELERCLEPGLARLNWNNRGIDAFVATTTRAVTEFQALHHSVQKSGGIMEKLVGGIAAARLVADLPPGGEVMELQEFYEHMEQHRAAAVDAAVSRYRSLTPLLGKIEELVAGTNSGKAPQLGAYYSYWEMAVFNALVVMVLRGLDKLHGMLGSAGKRPLFKLKTSLQNSEVVVAPPVKEAGKLLSAYVKNVAESCREFVRWMDGTCVEMPDQRRKGDTDGDPLVLHFSSEVLRMQQVMAAAVQLHQDISKLTGRLNRHVEGWRKSSDIWKADRGALMDKFKARAPPTAAFEDKFAKFQKVRRRRRGAMPRRSLAGGPARRPPPTAGAAAAAGCMPTAAQQAAYFWEQAHDVDVGCVSVSNAALALAVHEECCAWTRALTGAMRELDAAAVAGLRERMVADAAALRGAPADLEQLKAVLHVVAAVRSGGMAMELQCADLVERFRTRLLYAISEAEQAAAAAELADAARLSDEWAALCAEAEAVDARLEGVKRAFSQTTRQQVEAFAAVTADLEARMRAAGPGLPSRQLPAGLELLKAFQEEAEGLARQREALRLAEQLFDMDATSYPCLSKVESELRRLAAVYAVYAEHAEAVRQYGAMLWSELDVGAMMAGVQGVAGRLKKLKAATEDLPVYALVAAEVAGFADSLPLMRELKSEALRPRHWKQLMAVTGQAFELDPKTFTLSAMFDMQLHKFADDIARITSAALKELTIENELRKLAEAWKEQRFDLHKYSEGGCDRGCVLKGVDEVSLLLEDMGLNLQSMLASPHVRPFADEVRAWEQRLSLIAECIEVWMLVQRKWMYLEGIFIGSDDIRSQLPAEAKRFDGIDRTWLKIMADTAKNTNVLDACSTDGRFYFISDDELLAILGTSDPTSVQEHMLKLFDNCAALKFGRGDKSITGMVSSEGEAFAFRSVVPVEGPVEGWMRGVEAEMRRTLAAVMKEGDRWIADVLGMVTLAGSAVWWTWETEDAFRRVREGDKHAMKGLATKLTDQLAQLTGMVRGELGADVRRKVNTLIITDVHARDIVHAFVRDSVMDAREFAWESQLRFYWDKPTDDLAIRQCSGAFRYGYEFMGQSGRLVITALTDRCYMTLTTAMTFRLGGAPAGPAGTGARRGGGGAQGGGPALRCSLAARLPGAAAVGDALSLLRRGAGKTETVKDLAKAMGVQCVVFNCGEGLDYKAMGGIFSGLVQCGAWGCFDEFNRIEAEVLSVVSSQIKQIQEALKNDLARFQFEGREIRLDPRCGIFITMNPGYAGAAARRGPRGAGAGAGAAAALPEAGSRRRGPRPAAAADSLTAGRRPPRSAGRTELPDNLKALFRPVTMVVPDMEQICEIMLFSEGFDSAKVWETGSAPLPRRAAPRCAPPPGAPAGTRHAAPAPQVLAKKMTVLYKLAREQLSKQHHYVSASRAPAPRLAGAAPGPATRRARAPRAPPHRRAAAQDFGLRALKSVLVMAGALKRGAPGMSEALVLMRALRDSNLPKCVYDDVPLFLGLVGDLFPGMDCPRVRYPRFNDAVEAELAAAGLQVLAGPGEQVDKVVQLHEVLMTRHTVMLVGQTGGGKSAILGALARAQTALGRRTALHVLNPKALPVSELYGVLDKDTRDWTDGLLSNIFRRGRPAGLGWARRRRGPRDARLAARRPTACASPLLCAGRREVNRPLPPERDEAAYIVFDGDVDAVWVENMNSVMDDNKLLTLPNGERIRLQPHAKLLFEVADLQYASPATISRCGMVYVDSRVLGYRPYVWRWLNGRTRPGEAEALSLLFDKYAAPAIDWVSEGLDGHDLVRRPAQSVPHTALNMAAQLCRLLDATIVLDALFLFCVVWSVGALLVQRPEARERERFDALLRSLAGLGTLDAERVSASQLPARSLYDYAFDVGDGCWRSWRSYAAPYTPPPGLPFAQILVPTADSVRRARPRSGDAHRRAGPAVGGTTWLLKTVVGAGSPCLLVGESGTSKSVTVAAFLAGLDPGTHASLTMSFSSRTSSLDVQRAIEDAVEKRTKDTFGPPLGRRLLLFLDDLNMPRVDAYGTQQPLTLMRTFVERRGFYDRGKELGWKHVKDVQALAAMGPPGGARNAVDPRFVSLFSAFGIAPPGADTLRTIFQARATAGAILGGHLARDAAPGVAEALGESLTDVTLELYAAVLEALPPTPSRFHYVFNLRDLSRVYEGLLRSTPATAPGPAELLRLWRNEVLRVFHDRLISAEDKGLLQAKVAELVTRRRVPARAARATPTPPPRRYAPLAERVLVEPVLFGDFGGLLADPDGPGGPPPRRYADLGSYASLQPLAEAALAAYNADAAHRPMALVFFDDALEHLARITRTLRLPLGHCLLVGVGGSGKQSLARLAAHMAGAGVFEIVLTRGYDEAAFREDLKALYTRLGGRGGAPTVLLFTDSHVADEGFMELVNNMLTSGVVPALFDDAEKEALVADVRAQRAAAGLPDGREVCWGAYVEQCRANLHVVLAMSPVGEALRTRCRNFPGLVNSTVIDWFEPWPEQARRGCRLGWPAPRRRRAGWLARLPLMPAGRRAPPQALSSVASAFLEAEDLPAALRPAIVEHMVLVHQSVRRFSAQFAEELRRHNYVTPKNYLDFIATYRRSLAARRRDTADSTARLSSGLAKLEQAATEVDGLQRELSRAQVVVAAATAECDALLASITTSTADAEGKQRAAVEKEAQLQVESVQIAADKADAEQALSEAIPALEDAAAALNDLKRDDITEIRSFAKPHVLVQRVCECVVILKGLKDVSWGGAKSMMTDPGFLKSLVEFDKDGLSEKQVKRVRGEYMRDPGFTHESLRTVSTAGAGLLKWVLAMVNYYAVAKGVEPKRRKVAEAEKNLRLAQRDLADTKDQLAALNTQLAALRAAFADKTAEQQARRARGFGGGGCRGCGWRPAGPADPVRAAPALPRPAAQDLRSKADLVERRLLAAERLIAGLGSERLRWAADVRALEASSTRLVGDCLLCSSFLSYTGAFTHKYRSEMVYGLWQSDLRARGVPLSEPFSLERVMTTDVEVAAWASEGLPGDELSVQNGLLTTRAARWPLCIDPQQQAVAWIKRREGKQLEGKVKSFHDPDFLKALELAVQYGSPLLLEGCDEYIDPVIDPVLERAPAGPPGPGGGGGAGGAGGKVVIRLGDKEVELDPNFRLYLTTRLPNPHYGPEGLAEQLLAVTVAHERPDLEEARAGLVADMSTNKALLKRLEDTLLRELSAASGNILDNGELIATLEGAKDKAVDIAAKLEAARRTAAAIDDARVRYVPAAARGATLFFVLAGLSRVSSMYEYSLAAFLKVFNASLAGSKREATLEGRLRAITDTLTWDVFAFTCLGLFERHKLMLSFQMAVKVLEGGPAALDPALLDFFLKGSLSLEPHAQPRPHDWLPAQGWQDLMRLTDLAAARPAPDGGRHPLCGVADDIAAHGNAWRAYCEADAPESAALPGGLSAALTQFEALLLLRCLRVDRVSVGVSAFVAATLGERFVSPPVLDYGAIFRQSSETTPVVFVLSPGADPAFDVFRRAAQLRRPPLRDRLRAVCCASAGPVSRGGWGSAARAARAPARRLGEELGFKPGAKLKYMALGQGMGPKAAELIEAGAARGLWVMLQNVHLLPRWLSGLDKLLDRLTRPHKDFRLWLTTEPSEAFPLGLLQRSLKVVTEPPNGLRLNMRQSFGKISEDVLSQCEHPAFRPLVYVLAFFHAVERRKYGKLGWNVAYDFNETDFRISLALIATYLGKALARRGAPGPAAAGSAGAGGGEEGTIPWATLRYLIGEAMYGGRVSDSFDRRVLGTYLEEYLGDFLFDAHTPFHLHVSRDGAALDVPPPGPREAYAAAIDALPVVQSPEVFGLHGNADISHYTSVAKALWANLVDLQPRVGAAPGSVSRDDFVRGVARDVAAKLPEPFDLPLLAKGLGVVLLQELARWNGVLEAMAASLKDLQRALSGEVGFSAALEELCGALYNGKLPPAWARLNPATEKPLGPWMAWFARRTEQHGCYVSGLYLEGAAWDREAGKICRQAPRQTIIPVEASRAQLAGTFRAPVYVTQARRGAMGGGLVFEADLATDAHASHWVLQGVALVLNTDR